MLYNQLRRKMIFGSTCGLPTNLPEQTPCYTIRLSSLQQNSGLNLNGFAISALLLCGLSQLSII